MFSKKTEDGFVGVITNFDKTHVLLQLTKDEDQIRMKFTPKETLDLIKQLTKHLEELGIMDC